MSAIVYSERDWEHGLRCAECSRLFVDGMEVCERLESVFEDGTVVVLIVCEWCDLGNHE